MQSVPESRTAALNTPLQLGEEEGDDIVLTIKNITRSTTCIFGANSQELVNRELEPNKQLLQITAELHVKRMDGSYSDSFSLSDIKVRDSDNYVTRVHSSMFCNEGDSHNDWDERIETGDKARVYGAFFVPEDIQEARIEGFKIPLDGNHVSSRNNSKPRKMGGDQTRPRELLHQRASKHSHLGRYPHPLQGGTFVHRRTPPADFA